MTNDDPRRPAGQPPIDPRLLLAVGIAGAIGLVLLYALTIFDAC